MLSLQLETCVDLAQEERQELRERLEKLVSLSKESLLEVRHYIFDLKPYLAGEKGLVSMVENQVSEFNKVTGVPAVLNTKGEEHPMPVPVSTSIYRVTQEALANIFKHAQATQVNILLEFQGSGVQLTVKDNGQGFDPKAPASGNGLRNMRQRAEELGGFRPRHPGPHQFAMPILAPTSVIWGMEVSREVEGCHVHGSWWWTITK